MLCFSSLNVSETNKQTTTQKKGTINYLFWLEMNHTTMWWKTELMVVTSKRLELNQQIVSWQVKSSKWCALCVITFHVVVFLASVIVSKQNYFFRLFKEVIAFVRFHELNANVVINMNWVIPQYKQYLVVGNTKPAASSSDNLI